MRLTVVVLLMVSMLRTNGQTLSGTGNFYPSGDSVHIGRKWSLSTFGGMFTSYNAVYGSNSGIVAGLRLNRQLSNNWFAFASLTAAPVFNFNSAFPAAGFSKPYQGMNFSNANRFGVYTGIGGGLMYVNDQKTFSISGSINVNRSDRPAYFAPGAVYSQQPARTF